MKLSVLSIFRLIKTPLVYGLALGVVLCAQLVAMPVAAQVMDAEEREARALVRAMDFVRGLDNRYEYSIFVVYDGTNATSQVMAENMTAVFQGLIGRASKNFARVETVDIRSLPADGSKIEVMFLVPGMSAHFKTIFNYAVKHHVFTMSSDATCTQEQGCILSAISGEAVDIYLNQKTMKAIGFDFDAAFKFIAKQI